MFSLDSELELSLENKWDVIYSNAQKYKKSQTENFGFEMKVVTLQSNLCNPHINKHKQVFFLFFFLF